MEFEKIDIWIYLAIRIAENFAKKHNLTLTWEMFQTVREELRVFNQNHVVQIFFQMPSEKEMRRVYDLTMHLAKEMVGKSEQGLNTSPAS